MSKEISISYKSLTKKYPLIVGTRNTIAIQGASLLKDFSLMFFDTGYGNTIPAKSSITYINGEKGELSHRGYNIKDICDKKDFLDSIYLILYGEFPTNKKKQEFYNKTLIYRELPNSIIQIVSKLPKETHPMMTLNVIVSSLASFYSKFNNTKEESIKESTFILLGALPSIIALAFCHLKGKKFSFTSENNCIVSDFIQMCFGKNSKIDKSAINIIKKFLILHIDHEFNCSTSTVRMICSSGATLFYSILGGIGALSGPLHGGANEAVIKMLNHMIDHNISVDDAIKKAKDKESNFKIMGIGHRVYKSYDPRALIVKKICINFLETLTNNNPLLDLAKELEKKVLNDSYFQERKLFPNVDFYTGLTYKALGFPSEFFTSLFVFGRLPGWISHWTEQRNDTSQKISRPRQLYIGKKHRTIN